jgi:RecT family protein
MAAEEKSIVPIKRSLVEALSRDYGMEAQPFLDAIKQTVFPEKDRKGMPPTMAHLVSYLSVCQQYGLNPFVGHVWAFPLRDGGFKPVASVDGWLHLMINHPQYDGHEYVEVFDDKGKVVAGEMTIFVKGRAHPTKHREWLNEVRRDTEPWRSMERRMLENRTTVQTARRTFGIGIPDEDDVQRAQEINVTADSIEMERTTATKSEALKEKIGAAKGKKTAEPPPAPAPAPAAAPTVFDKVKEVFDGPPAPAAEVASLFDEPPPLPVDKTPITEAQRVELMNEITKRFPPTEDKKLLPPVKAAIMKKLQAHGITATKDIIASDFKDFIEWARKFEPEKEKEK